MQNKERISKTKIFCQIISDAKQAVDVPAEIREIFKNAATYGVLEKSELEAINQYVIFNIK